MPEQFPYIGLLAIAPILVYAAYSDLRQLRIPNWTSIVMLAVFAILLPTLPMSEILDRVLLALIVLSLGFVLFAVNALGAGDVKLLSALVLFVPSGQVALFFLIFSPALLLGIVAICLMRAHPPARMAGWQSIVTPAAFPMGISIALTGLVFLALLAMA